MAIDVGNISSGSIKATVLTVAHTLAGTGRTVLIFVGHKNTRTVVSCTYAGVACTNLGSDQNVNGGSHIFYRENVDASGDAVFEATGVRETFMVVVDFGGADTPTDYTALSQTTGPTSSSVTVPNAVAGDQIWDGLLAGTLPAPGPDQTQQAAPPTVGGVRFGVSSQAGADGGVMSWTFSSTYSSQSACRLPQSGGAPPTNHLLEADAGSYAIAGQQVNTPLARVISLEAGAYAHTGEETNFPLTRAILADAGAYNITGEDANLIHSAGSQDFTVSCEAGAYNITGQQAALMAQRILDLEAGSYSVAGEEVAFRSAAVMLAEAGSYNVSGEEAALRASKVLQAGAGSYAITGEEAIFISGYTIRAQPGSYVISGQQVELLTSGITDLEWKAYQEQRHRTSEIRDNVDIVNQLAIDARDTSKAIAAAAVRAGYGGMNSTGGLGYSLGAGWTKYTDFDGLTVPTPRGITVDLINNRLAFTEPGIYTITTAFTFDHDELNAGRVFNLRVFDETSATPLPSVPIGVGRNLGVTNYTIALQLVVNTGETVQPDDFLSVELGGGDTITGDFLSFSFFADRVSQILV